MSRFWAGVAVMVLLIISSIVGGVYASYLKGDKTFEITGLVVALILIFLLLIFIGYRSNNKLNRSEVRRAIAATFVIALLMILFFDVETDVSVREFFFGVLSTVIGFYFGYRKSEDEQSSKK